MMDLKQLPSNIQHAILEVTNGTKFISDSLISTEVSSEELTLFSQSLSKYRSTIFNIYEILEEQLKNKKIIDSLKLKLKESQRLIDKASVNTKKASKATLEAHNILKSFFH